MRLAHLAFLTQEIWKNVSVILAPARKKNTDIVRKTRALGCAALVLRKFSMVTWNSGLSSIAVVRNVGHDSPVLRSHRCVFRADQETGITVDI